MAALLGLVLRDGEAGILIMQSVIYAQRSEQHRVARATWPSSRDVLHKPRGRRIELRWWIVTEDPTAAATAPLGWPRCHLRVLQEA